jgi:glycosyltransferase involved in cell wall biosynthesis
LPEIIISNILVCSYVGQSKTFRHEKMKTLICLITYQAEAHIEATISRLPSDVWRSTDYHILVSDDGSSDNTIDLASKVLARSGDNYTLLSISENQGYGGNQKVCYRFALEHGFDAVVLLHGDGQYAPEIVPTFRNLLNNGADVVLGSRILVSGAALKGGMPIYKFIGNRVLTKLQNILCGSDLSEFHTGYRGYTTKFLKSIPFELNSDEFHFDTEILLQAFHAGSKIEEFPIPTHYGNEICRVPTYRYSVNVLLESLRYRLQVFGLLTSIKYPHSSNKVYVNRIDDPYSVNSIVQSLICQGEAIRQTKDILDIGCGAGYLAEELTSMSFHVTTIDKFEPTASSKEKHVFMDLDIDPWTIDISQYDVILALDIVEHLNNPERFLLDLRNYMRSDRRPIIYLSTPNVGFFLVRIGLLLGRFSYADRGILDITHKRLFTLSSLRKLLEDTGYEIKIHKGIGPPILVFGRNPLFRALAGAFNGLARLFPRLFAFQLLMVAEPKVTTYRILVGAEREGERYDIHR